MDTRAVFNLHRRARLDSIPELRGIQSTAPSLTADGRADHAATVTLVVPTFFNKKLKAASMSHVLSGLHRSANIMEVLVVHCDGDTQEKKFLERLICDRPLSITTAPANNRAQARNVGACSAQGEYLLFLDDDMLVRDWRSIDVLIAKMIQETYDCALFPRRQYARFPLLLDPQNLKDTIEAWRQGQSSPGVLDLLEQETVDLPMLFCFPGCFMLIRKTAYDQLGGFDERYLGWGFEDTDFAVRAIRKLRVLNLFRIAEPLLHIDHPVSPYKLEEHRSNSSLFFSDPGTVDVHRLCRSVFPGLDFHGADNGLLSTDIHLAPFAGLPEKGIPMVIDELRGWLLGIARDMLERFASPVPEFILLHGSRATHRARPNSDYDVLCLYPAPLQEFFVTGSDPPVEIECTSALAFMALAEMPWLYDTRGVFDLTKVAQARLLHGCETRWESWREELLRDAVANGRAFWLILGLGLLLKPKRHGTVVEHYFGSLRHLLELAGTTEDLPHLLSPTLDTFGDHVRGVLERTKPQWRRTLTLGEKLFPLQVPEIGSALRWLHQGVSVSTPASIHADATR